MPLRSYKATSPGMRSMTRSTFEEITTDKPHKPLLEPQEARQRAQQPGSSDRPPSRRRREAALPAHRLQARQVRRARAPGDHRVRPQSLGAHRAAPLPRRREALHPGAPTGSRSATSSSPARAPRREVGNALPLANIPLGTTIHNIELVPGKGGQIVRSAGASAQLLAKEGDYAQIRLPSGEVRRASLRCMATVGQVGNLDHENQNLGKAGRARHMGQRPEVRGVVMNPRDHPHGGGEGKSPTGMPPKTPWGQPAMGHRTRRNKIDRPASSAPGTARAREEETMSRSLKKGPFVEARLLGRVQEMNRSNEKKVAQDLVARERHLPRLHRPHDRRLQRQEAHPGLRDREHGRPSTR